MGFLDEFGHTTLNGIFVQGVPQKLGRLGPRTLRIGTWLSLQNVSFRNIGYRAKFAVLPWIRMRGCS